MGLFCSHISYKMFSKQITLGNLFRVWISYSVVEKEPSEYCYMHTKKAVGAPRLLQCEGNFEKVAD